MLTIEGNSDFSYGTANDVTVTLPGGSAGGGGVPGGPPVGGGGGEEGGGVATSLRTFDIEDDDNWTVSDGGTYDEDGSTGETETTVGTRRHIEVHTAGTRPGRSSSSHGESTQETNLTDGASYSPAEGTSGHWDTSAPWSNQWSWTVTEDGETYGESGGGSGNYGEDEGDYQAPPEDADCDASGQPTAPCDPDTCFCEQEPATTEPAEDDGPPSGATGGLGITVLATVDPPPNVYVGGRLGGGGGGTHWWQGQLNSNGQNLVAGTTPQGTPPLSEVDDFDRGIERLKQELLDNYDPEGLQRRSTTDLFQSTLRLGFSATPRTGNGRLTSCVRMSRLPAGRTSFTSGLRHSRISAKRGPPRRQFR